MAGRAALAALTWTLGDGSGYWEELCAQTLRDFEFFCADAEAGPHFCVEMMGAHPYNTESRFFFLIMGTYGEP